MDRRNFLRLLATGIVGMELDLDRLLWIPGAKKIFLPTPHLSIMDIVNLEMEKMIREMKIKNFFERDDIFYRALRQHDIQR